MIIFYGGTDGTNSSSAVVGYSPSGDTPLTLASMSVARSYLGYAPDRSGNAYAIGGLDNNGARLRPPRVQSGHGGRRRLVCHRHLRQRNMTSLRFLTAPIRFTFLADAQTQRPAQKSPPCCVIRSTETPGPTWRQCPSRPPEAAAFGVDGKIYVVGGVSGGVTTDGVQVYDPAANSWAISTPLPGPLSGCAMGVDSLGRLIVMGGMDAKATTWPTSGAASN